MISRQQKNWLRQKSLINLKPDVNIGQETYTKYMYDLGHNL